MARTLGVTLTRVRQIEKAGKLHPQPDADGVQTFSRQEVVAFVHSRPPRKKTDGAIAARAFQMFKDGFPFPEIVIETMQSPETVRRLFEEYRRPLVTGHDELLEHFDKTAKETDARIAEQQKPPESTHGERRRSNA